MAITPSDYARKCDVTIAHTFGSAQTGFVAVLTENSLPGEIFTTALNGGGDIRICTDDGGVNQLPIEVVKFDTVASEAVIWVRMPTANTASELWLFYGKAGESQPAVDALYGRNAVWADYASRWHLENYKDSTGKSNDLIPVGSPTTLPVQVGDGVNFASGSDYLYTDTVEHQSGDSFTISFWYHRRVGEDLPLGGIAVGIADSANAYENYYVGLSRSGETLYVTAQSRRIDQAVQTMVSIPSLLEGESIYVSVSQDATGSYCTAIHQDGTVYTGTSNRYLTNASAFNRLSLNRLMDSSPATGAQLTLDEVSLTSNGFYRTQDFAVAEYANQSNPATFWTVGTPSDTTTSTGVTADTDITISKPTFASTASATLPAPVANVTFALPEPLFNSTATASLPQPIASTEFTVTNLTFASTASATLPQPSASAEFTVTAPTFSASASATLPYPQATASFNIDKPTFVATGSATQPQPIADVTVTLTAPQFTASASATLPQPTADAYFELGKPTFNATATATTGATDISFDVDKPTFTASATATLPQPTAGATWDIQPPQFSVNVTVSGVVIVAADNARITLPAASNRITLQAASNRITLQATSNRITIN